MITWDRYVAIVSPLHYYQRITKTRISFMLISVWSIAAAFVLPLLFVPDAISYHAQQYSCSIGSDTTTKFNYIYNTLFVLLGFLLPLLIMIFAYFRMYTVTSNLLEREKVRVSGFCKRLYSVNAASKVSRRTNKYTPPNREPTRGSWLSQIADFIKVTPSGKFRQTMRLHVGDEWRAAKSGLLVLSAFVMTWLPYFVVIMLETVMGEIDPTFQWVALWLSFFSSPLNSYVYILRRNSMRIKVQGLFCSNKVEEKKKQKMAMEHGWTMRSGTRMRSISLLTMAPPPPSCTGI